MRILAALVVLLLLAAPVLAHGEGPKTVFVTDTGCALSGPPCLRTDSGSSVEPGAEAVVVFRNELDAEQDVMVHLDDDGVPGSLLTDVTSVAPGGTRQVSFDVPADATGVWFMAVTDDGETARLFGAAVSDDHGAEGEDSPGAGVVLLLGVVAAAVALRRKP